MFFWISKVLEFLYSPLTWIIVALLLAFFLKKPVRKKRMFVAALVMIFVFTNSFLASEAMRLWEVSDSDMNEQIVYDVAIVLGGGMITYDAQNEKHHFRVNTDRILQALRMMEEGKVDRILISGGSGSLAFRDMTEACLLRDYCGQLGHDTSKILTECISDNTYQNALHSVKILNDSLPQGGNFLLITSASHMRRAKAVFKKAGLTFHIFPTNPIAGPRRYDPYFLLVPSTSALRTWEIFFKETAGYVTYKIAGYL
jgi:uncharacterized SAM-binding protein YcdF (DUF218 family)